MYEFKLYELCISTATFSNVRRNNDWRGCPHRVKTTAQSSQKVVEAYFVIEIVHLIWQNHMVSNCHNQSGVSGLIKLTDRAPYFAEYIYEHCLCSDWGLPNILKSNWNFQTYAYFYSSAVSFLGGQQHPQPWASSASGNASLTPLPATIFQGLPVALAPQHPLFTSARHKQLLVWQTRAPLSPNCTGGVGELREASSSWACVSGGYWRKGRMKINANISVTPSPPVKTFPPPNISPVSFVPSTLLFWPNTPS